MIGTAALLDGLLTASAAALTSASRDVPERRYVSHGDPVVDSYEALTVHTTGLRLTTPTPGVILRTVPMVVTLVRAVPVPDNYGTPPAADELRASAMSLADDLDALLDGLTQAWAAGELWGDSCCEDVRWGLAAPRRIETGYGGWTVAVEVDP